MRDLPAVGIQFWSYDLIQKYLQISDSTDILTIDKITNFEMVTWIYILKKMVAGGLSGSISWAVSTPMDNVKTVIQSQYV